MWRARCGRQPERARFAGRQPRYARCARRHFVSRRCGRAALPHRAHAANALSGGILSKQRAIVFGNFRMGTITVMPTTAAMISAACSTPYSGWPRCWCSPVFLSGISANKATFPLGAHAKIRSSGNGGYSVTFSGYPTLDAGSLFAQHAVRRRRCRLADLAACKETVIEDPVQEVIAAIATISEWPSQSFHTAFGLIA